MPEDKLIIAREVTERTGIPRNAVYELVKRGEIPHIRLGERIFFRPSRIDRWFDEQERASLTEVA